MSERELTKIAEQVSLLMQIDRLQGQAGAGRVADVGALRPEINLPAYLTSVFEAAHEIGSDLSPAEIYRQVNRRISQIQAQLYLMRLELENRAPFDPAEVLGDPMAVALQGERVDAAVGLPRTFEFAPDIVAQGWHPAEIDETGAHRWMAPGPVSVACIPHLGEVDQIIEINGNFVEPEQFGNLSISVGPVEAEIYKVESDPRQFVARMTFPAAVVQSARFVPVAFRMTDFRQPSEQDSRQLGANVARFTCRPALRRPPEPVDETVEEDAGNLADRPLTGFD